jgi:hypothetical protein|tara:strand:- start:837 stop:1241 length:405 start_codon:yes stop_codon:yes gene_type:complete
MEDKKDKPKGPIGKLQEFAEDKEEQLVILSTFVRLGILVWSGAILTLNYVTIPGWEQDKIDPTFIASVFTGVTATFGIQTGGKKKNGENGGGVNITKKDMEMLIAKAAEAAPTQTIRLEQGPVTISASPNKKSS